MTFSFFSMSIFLIDKQFYLDLQEWSLSRVYIGNMISYDCL